MMRMWKPLSIVASLLLLLTYLLIQSRSRDLARRTRMQEALQRRCQLNVSCAELSPPSGRDVSPARGFDARRGRESPIHVRNLIFSGSVLSTASLS
jgi:hypothetical protein